MAFLSSNFIRQGPLTAATVEHVKKNKSSFDSSFSSCPRGFHNLAYVSRTTFTSWYWIHLHKSDRARFTWCSRKRVLWGRLHLRRPCTSCHSGPSTKEEIDQAIKLGDLMDENRSYAGIGTNVPHGYSPLRNRMLCPFKRWACFIPRQPLVVKRSVLESTLIIPKDSSPLWARLLRFQCVFRIPSALLFVMFSTTYASPCRDRLARQSSTDFIMIDSELRPCLSKSVNCSIRMSFGSTWTSFSQVDGPTDLKNLACLSYLIHHRCPLSFEKWGLVRLATLRVAGGVALETWADKDYQQIFNMVDKLRAPQTSMEIEPIFSVSW
jgi:hypothetical protein